MKEGKPFFYRIEASEFFAVVRKISSDKELGKYIRQFASDLVARESTSDYATKVIAEAIEYINQKRVAGSKGGKQRVSNAQAPLKHRLKSASSESQARSSSSTEAVTETEEIKEEIGDKSPPPSILFNLWNKIVKEPRATVMNKTREAKCRLRLKERPHEQWEVVFQRIKDSPFCCGDNNRGWRADFDWIISNDTNAVKVMEGKYDNGKGKEQPIENPFEKLRRGGYES